MSAPVSLTFPDGSVREYPAGSTGRDVAEAISKSLAKKAIAIALDGELRDLSDPVSNGRIEIVTREDDRALELIRHDAAHVMAEAVQELWPGTQVTIGPVIENGFYYDFSYKRPFTPDDLPKIEKRMKEIIQRNKPFTKEIWSRDKAKDVFAGKGETYKVELVDAIPAGQDLKIYYQGDWFDLCRGPHMAATGQIGTAFKLMKVAGAYWRGDHNNEQLQRIYGTAWASKDDLQGYLTMLEEAEKRDHRKIGKELDLFHIDEHSPGTVFWHPKGWRMFQTLVAYMRRRLAGTYEEVNAPQVLDKSLWETSGHWGWYRDNMFKVTVAGDETDDERVFALKPMNCPGHILIYKQGIKSYRDLPLRYGEFGQCHRNEPTGGLHGIMRVRGFTQDDGHIFCTEDMIQGEVQAFTTLLQKVYKDFGFTEIIYKLSTRPEKRIGSDALWDRAESVMMDVLKQIEAQSGGRIKTGILPGEGAFYGPKFEYTLKDAIGREWQCGTTQVDFNLPERFGAFYIDQASEKRQPVMIHRAICGSMERFLGILIENFAGHMPLWIAPMQVVVATITSEADDYAREVADKLRDAGMTVETDLRNEKINYKVREHSVTKVPVIIVCGKREAEERSVNIRRLGSQNQTAMTLTEAIETLSLEAMAPDLKRKLGKA
ncbi:UNVERIFIED_ORG: threonine--tRNA ligase [Roseateles sp. XES5]|nr:threonine--tRNA ligase [Roseateles sp. XES5]